MLKKIFFYIAVAGWGLSLIIHLLTFVGYDIFARISFSWMFLSFFLVFAVWIAAAIYLIRSEEYEALNPLHTLKSIYNRIPFWASVICCASFAYFFIIVLVDRYFPTEGGMTKIATSTGLFFYAIAAAILFPTEKQVENDL